MTIMASRSLTILFTLLAATACGPGGPAASPSERDTTPAPNIANARLLKFSSSEQASFLGLAVGEGCRGVKAFYMGSSKRDEAFWSVKCSDSRKYAVMISPDSTGSTRVMECSLLKAVNAGECFKRF
jgi:hypothetical protein